MTVYDIGGRKQVFVDWRMIEAGYGLARGGAPAAWEMPTGVRLRVHPPHVAPQPIISADRPWESTIGVYSTLMAHDGNHRLYYECYGAQRDGEVSGALLACVETVDGVHWTRPVLCVYEYEGSTANNIVFGPRLTHGRGVAEACVFSDPSAPPAARYKLVHTARVDGGRILCGAVSPDGVHWRALGKPLLSGYYCDAQNVVYYDAARGCYRGYFRGWQHGRRVISYAETGDFAAWPIPDIIVEPDAADAPDVDIYTSGYTRWPGAHDVHLMFSTFYRRAQDTLAVHLLTSRDGLRWARPSRTPLIAPGDAGEGSRGGVYAGCGVAALRAGEWSLPIAPRQHTHNQPFFPESLPARRLLRNHIARGWWRQDGFMSLEAETEGRCTTVPFTFTGSRLTLNACTRFGGEVSVELATADGSAIPGFSFAECDAFRGDSLREVMTWQGASDVSSLANRPLRLRLRLRRAHLFAWQFEASTG